jgi:two-component system response regulator AtoC
MKTESTVMDDAVPTVPVPTASPGEFHLLVMSPDAFSTLPLPREGALLVGRSTRAEVTLSDPLASGEHATLQVGATISITDCGSKNGTRVRDERIPANQPTTLQPGEAVVIGATILMVQRNRAVVSNRRLWTHLYFEGRLEEECAKADATGIPFAVARLRLNRALPWTAVVPVFAKHLPPPDLFAAYGPCDYEALIAEPQSSPRADAVLANIRTVLESRGVQVKVGVARYPRDGRSSDALIARANERIKDRPASSDPATNIDWGSEMQRLHQDAARAAAAKVNILILGETGVGKEVMAKALHRMSRRASKPLVTLNCAGMTESLLESELFGHEKGSFTGATQARAGLLEAAHGGTLFLDELGEMPLSFQQRLLRVLEDGKVRRVGSNETRDVDVRFISATNRDLEAEIEAGGFRLDLFYRLNKMTFTIPPLRERISEIESLAARFLASACEEQSRTPMSIAPEAMAWLRRYSWPGNIRELRNLIERAVVLCEGDVLQVEDLPTEKLSAVTGTLAPLVNSGHRGRSLPVPARPREAKDDEAWDLDRVRVIDALDAHGWNQGRAAVALGITRRTLSNWLDYYMIPRPQKYQGQGSVDVTSPTE